MQPKNLFAVAFMVGSLGLGSLVACGKSAEAVVSKDPSAVGVTSGAEPTPVTTAGKGQTPGGTTSDTKGGMGGGTDRAVGDGNAPKGGVAPTATHTTGPAPRNTGDPPPDPNKK